MPREINVRPTVEAIQRTAKVLREMAEKLENEARELQEDKDFIHVEICVQALCQMPSDLHLDTLMFLPSEEKKRQRHLDKLDLQNEIDHLQKELKAAKDWAGE
jgi:hypothetical protein